MSAHTPGPWVCQRSISDTCDFEVVQPFVNGDVIAGEYGIEDAANANLIAAAPDLLAFAEWIAANIVLAESVIGEQARLVIAKATGADA